MARVAVVTGGTRGIGGAISQALKAAGYSVAANYAGNEEAATKFSRPRPAFRLQVVDVADFDACKTGVDQIEAKDARPRRRSGQQRRHHARRARCTTMTPREVGRRRSTPISAPAST